MRNVRYFSIALAISIVVFSTIFCAVDYMRSACLPDVKVAIDDNINWPKLIWAVGQVESSGNPKARNGRYHGMLQISKGCLRDVNKKYNTSLTIHDAYDPKKAAWVFRHYGLMYNAKSAEEFCRIWRSGPNKRHSAASLLYWYKVKALYDQSRSGVVCTQSVYAAK